MGVSKEYDLGQVNLQVNVSGMEQFQKSIQGIAETLNKVIGNRGFEKYWKSQEDLIRDVDKALREYNDDMYNTSKQEHLIKSVNALKAVAGGDIFDGMTSGTKEAFNAVSQLSGAATMVKDAFSPANFRAAFDAFELLQEAGMNTTEVLSVLSSGADTSTLRQQLAEAKNEAADFGKEVDRLNEKLKQTENGQALIEKQRQIDDLKKQIDNAVGHSRREFKDFLDYANLNPFDNLTSFEGKGDSAKIEEFKERVFQLYDQIESGEIGAKRAIGAIKSEFAGLIDGIGKDISLDDFFNSNQMQDFMTKFETMCTQVDTLSKKMGDNLASMFTEAMNNPELSQAMSAGFSNAMNTGGIKNISEFAQALTSQLGEVDGQTTNIINDFKEILTIIENISKTDVDNLMYVSSSFESLKSIGHFNVDAKALEQLRSALEAISQISHVENLAYLKNISLDGFKDLKISKASMNNLSEHLSILAKLDINKLQGLSTINLKNFNDLHISKASMEALSSFLDKIKDIAQYSKELEHMAQILQSSASKMGQLQNAVSGGSGANNVAQQAKQAASSRALLDQATQDLLKNIGTDSIETPKVFGSVDEFNKKNEETTKALEDVISTIQQGKGEIDKITFTTNTMWGTNDKGEAVATEKLTGALITYRNELGQTIQTQYEWHEALSEGEDRFFAASRSRITDTTSGNANLEKLARDKEKAISDFTKKLASIESNALDKATNKPLTDDSITTVSGEIEEIRRHVEELNNADVSNFYEKFLEIDRSISSVTDHIKVLRNADNVTTFSGKSTEKIFENNESSFRVLQQDIKDAGINLETAGDEANKLKGIMAKIQGVMNLDPDERTSENVKEMKDDIINARKEFEALKKEARPENLIKNTSEQLASVVGGGSLNSTVYQQASAVATQKIEELNEQLRSGSITQTDYKNKVKATIDELQRMSSAVLDLGKNLDEAEVEMKTSKFVAQNYSGKQVTPQTSTKGNVTTLTYQWEDEKHQVQQLVFEYDRMAGSLRQVSRSQKEVKKTGGFWKGLKESFIHMSKYLITFGSFYRVIGWVKQGVTYVKELDDALTEMRKVSDETVDSLKKFQKASFGIADSIGATAKAIQDSTADFMKLGYAIDEASQLAKDANIYANVGDMEINEATEHMISSIKAWESEFGSVTEASTAIIDKYNEIGNNFAITSAGIGEAMERSAAALKAGGNTLNEALGLITAGNLIQQDAETTANALKVLSLRIRGSKTELEEMGEETDGLASSTSKLRDEMKALTGVDIMLDENTYKSTAQIIKEIGAVWDKLTDVQQANVLEKLAGKTRASVVAGLMENYTVIDDVIKSAENADGSAAEENEKYLDSMQGKINQLTNHIQEFWNVLLNSDGLKNLIDILDNLVQLATKFADSWAFLPTVITGIVAAAKHALKSGGRAKKSVLVICHRVS